MLSESVLLGSILYTNVLHVEGRAFLVRDKEGDYIAYVPPLGISDYLMGPDPFVSFFDVAGVRLRHTSAPNDEGPVIVDYAGVELHAEYVLIDGLWTRHGVTLFEGATDVDKRALCVAFRSLCSCGGFFRGRKKGFYCDRCGVLKPSRVLPPVVEPKTTQLALRF